MQKEQQVGALSIPRQLEEKGFAIVPGVLTSATMNDVIDRIKAHLAERTGRSGHAMRHLVQLVPAVQKVAESPGVRALVEPVLGPKAFVVRSLFFDKTPEANWKVAWHQDLTIVVRNKIEVPQFFRLVHERWPHACSTADCSARTDAHGAAALGRLQ